MSRTYKDSKKAGTRRRRERHLSVRAVPKNPPDLKKFSRALIQLALAQSEADAQAQGSAESTDQAVPEEGHRGD